MCKRCFLSYVLIIVFISNVPVSLAQSEKKYAGLPNFHLVNSKLYRGAQPHSDGWLKLKELGVKTIINLRASDDKAVKEKIEVEKVGMRYFNIPLERLGKPSDEQIDEILSIINAKENQPVFIHCHKGQDRTGTVIAIYRITHDQWTVEDALREAEKYGMKFWQLGMKDYIREYTRQKSKIKKSGLNVVSFTGTKQIVSEKMKNEITNS